VGQCVRWLCARKSSRNSANLHPRALPIIETFCQPDSLIGMQGFAQVVAPTLRMLNQIAAKECWRETTA